MPFQLLQYLPGVTSEESRITASNRYIDCNHVRFWEGFARKIGGTIKYSNNQFLGICRGLWAWITLADKKYIALGTNLKLYINEGGTYFDITPLRDSGTLPNDPIATTSGSAIVTIHSIAHGEIVGDYVSFSGATAVNGITVSGAYTVLAIVDVDHFTINTGVTASGTGSGGGAAVLYEYQITIGVTTTTNTGGWGIGTWGTGTWGTPRGGLITYARTWALHNFGEDLIASPRDLGIYKWTAASGLTVRAVIVSNAPITNKFVVVSSENRYIIALGAHDGATSDPMLIRWCSQDDITDWTPTTTNTAGDQRLTDGNYIMTGCTSRGQIIISTDTTIYAMYPDSQFVFGFKTLGVGGALGPNAMIEHNGIVYWMGSNNFYLYDGTIRIINCDVRSFVFDNLNRLQAYKIYAGINIEWNELWFFYTDMDSSENNRYVAYNFVEQTWHYGSWERTAWLDRNVVSPDNPIATNASGYMFTHEFGVDDDGAALAVLLQTGDMQIKERNRFIYIRRFIPDFKEITGSIDVEIQTRLYPQDDMPNTSSSFTVLPNTKYVSPRVRGDEFSIILESDVVGNDFWLGTCAIEYVETGVR